MSNGLAGGPLIQSMRQSRVRFGPAPYSVPDRLVGGTVPLDVLENRGASTQVVHPTVVADHALIAPRPVEISIVDERLHHDERYSALRGRSARSRSTSFSARLLTRVRSPHRHPSRKGAQPSIRDGRGQATARSVEGASGCTACRGKRHHAKRFAAIWLCARQEVECKFGGCRRRGARSTRVGREAWQAPVADSFAPLKTCKGPPQRTIPAVSRIVFPYA